jgi:hypothetical protein
VASAIHSIRLGGWPEGPAKAKWQILSLVLNSNRINTPVLNEEADTEYLAYLALETSLEQLKKPAELWIYSGELHAKNQPRHLHEIAARLPRNLSPVWVSSCYRLVVPVILGKTPNTSIRQRKRRAKWLPTRERSSIWTNGV